MVIPDPALFAFAEHEVRGPFGPRGHHASGSFTFDDGFAGINACVHGLGAQGAFKAPSDNQHGCAMHQRPDGQHEAGVPAGRTAQAPRDSVSDEIE